MCLKQTLFTHQSRGPVLHLLSCCHHSGPISCTPGPVRCLSYSLHQSPCLIPQTSQLGESPNCATKLIVQGCLLPVYLLQQLPAHLIIRSALFMNGFGSYLLQIVDYEFRTPPTHLTYMRVLEYYFVEPRMYLFLIARTGECN